MVPRRLQRELRLFTVACVLRIWHLLGDGCNAAVLASERFADGQIAEPELDTAVESADAEAQAACHDHSTADAHRYAASAAIDASLRRASEIHHRGSRCCDFSCGGWSPVIQAIERHFAGMRTDLLG